MKVPIVLVQINVEQSRVSMGVFAKTQQPSYAIAVQIGQAEIVQLPPAISHVKMVEDVLHLTIANARMDGEESTALPIIALLVV